MELQVNITEVSPPRPFLRFDGEWYSAEANMKDSLATEEPEEYSPE